jgi:hypothetical protein
VSAPEAARRGNKGHRSVRAAGDGCRPKPHQRKRERSPIDRGTLIKDGRVCPAQITRYSDFRMPSDTVSTSGLLTISREWTVARRE